MLRGLDTSFLVQLEVTEHPRHRASRDKMDGFLDVEDTLVLAPQVLTEFVHIVTDSRRFADPVPVVRAIARAEFWWHAKEVSQAFPTDDSVRLFLNWLKEHRLGRKRLLDTHLAAVYFCHGVRSIVSSNSRDFTVFNCFEVVVP